MTTQQSRLKRGGEVHITASHFRGRPYHIFEVLEAGVVFDFAATSSAPHYFAPWSMVILPPEPKAKAGTFYRSKNDRSFTYVGLPSGRLANVGSVTYQFDPDQVEEVEE